MVSRKLGKPAAIDLRTIQCLVGRVPREREWGIIDRQPGEMAQTTFVEHGPDDDD